MDQLRIQTLGGLSIQRGGYRVRGFDTRKVMALLVYFACTGRSHSRQILAEMLWEDRSQPQSATNLRSALSSLRRLLDPQLTITRDMAGMNPAGNWWLDAAEFERALSGATQTSEQLKTALELYRGDFLEGFFVDSQAFEDWALLERERLRFLAMEALDILIARHLSEGAYSAGVTCASRLLQMDRLREETHRHMMELLARFGRREAALAQYETCSRLLSDELGVAPMVETTALYERIRSGQLVPDRVTGNRIVHLADTAPSGPHHNLPVQTTPFVGREAEMGGLARLLADPSIRLITILGPGGMGKTRLAIEAAVAQLDHFTHGVFFVCLAPLSTPAEMVQALAEAVGFQFEGMESGSEQRDSQQQLFDYLHRKHQLLVMDNFEQLLDGADLLTAILRAAPRVRILVTSRERLNLSSETIFTLGGMAFRGLSPLEEALRYDAVQLFVLSARRVRRDFKLDPSDLPELALIHHLVGGMPLGIVLAAAWADTFRPVEIAQELSKSFEFLTAELRDVPDRHRSMRGVFDSTWSRLDDGERHILCRLSVFRGGFTREGAHAVASASLHQLITLANKSLLQRNPVTGRFSMHELLRQYLEEQLDQVLGQSSAARAAHRAYYADFLAQKWQDMTTNRRMRSALDEIAIEIDNVRLAWHTMVAERNIAEIKKVERCLWVFLDLQCWFQEGMDLFRETAEALGRPDENPAYEPTRGLMLARMGWFMAVLAPLDVAGATIETALEILRRHDAAEELLYALNCYFMPLVFLGRFDQLRQVSEEAIELCLSSGHFREEAWAYYALGTIAMWHDKDYAKAKEFGEKGLRAAENSGDPWMTACILANLFGGVSQSLGENDAAKGYILRALQLFQEIGRPWGIGVCFSQLGHIALEQKHYAETWLYYIRLLNHHRNITPWHSLAALCELAELLVLVGEQPKAVELLYLIAQHPSSSQHSLEWARSQLDELSSHLPIDTFQTAEARGQYLDLDTVITDFLQQEMPPSIAAYAGTGNQAC